VTDRSLSHGRDNVFAGVPRTEIDLEADLEALRDLIIGGKVVAGRAWAVDVEEFEARLDQILALLPKEMRRARRIAREEQRILADAKEEARRSLEEARAEAEQTLAAARAEAERLVESGTIKQMATEQAEQILQRADETGGQIRQGAFDYARGVIESVETSLEQLLENVRADRESQLPPPAATADAEASSTSEAKP